MGIETPHLRNLRNLKRRELLSLLAFSLLFTAPHFWDFFNPKTPEPVLSEEILPDPFDIPITAKSVYVYDARTEKVLFEKNASIPFPLASVTKVMTALVAKEYAPEGTTVTVSEEALQTEGESFLKEGEKWSLDALIEYMLVVSSNDAAAAIAEAVEGARKEEAGNFVKRMNQFADILGLEQTYFLNPSGLDEGEILTGGYGSARDMAILFSYMLRNHPDLLEGTGYEDIRVESDLEVKVGKNTNKTLGSIPLVTGSKTGLTDIAGGNLVFSFDAGPAHPIIVSILGSTEEGRFEDAKLLSQATLEALR